MEFLPEPSRVKEFSDWMVWMANRAHLKDTSLTDFNFNNVLIPEPLIKATLMKAIGTNTHIEVLSLVNSNLMRQQGIELAAVLRANGTIKMLNLEANCLDFQ